MAKPVLQSPTNPHFFQPLLPGFHSDLSIPVKFFSKYIEGRNKKNMVELKSDACEKTWKVKMEGRKLTVGWKDFADAHDFRVGDIIIFRHEGDMVFHVTGLGPSCCEIQYVDDNIRNLSTKQNLKTEPDQSSPDDDVKVKDNMGKFPRNKHAKKRNLEAEAESSFSSDQPCLVVRVTDSNLQYDRLYLQKKFVRPEGLNKGSHKIVLMDEGGRTWTFNLRFRESNGTFYMRCGWRSFCNDNGLKPGDTVTFKQERNNTKTPLLRFSTCVESKRVSTKHSSKEKKIKTGEGSQSRAALSENRFVTLTVTPASFKDSRLYLPVNFTRVHKMEKAGGQEITLLDKHGVEWPVYLYMEKRYMRLRFASGLKEFFEALGVKANESFVLELVWEDKASPPMFKFCSMIKA
ncbi:unnamed protein product [Arabis nemorensis]|uniref:TF-B3 domain-containing protein n=1 Tax=Arabis nemorensis TaxID=586526 RepID=A0A565CB28_9BRAS|nr:unnamed protein product [Arabis nemorensis]